MLTEVLEIFVFIVNKIGLSLYQIKSFTFILDQPHFIRLLECKMKNSKMDYKFFRVRKVRKPVNSHSLSF